MKNKLTIAALIITAGIALVLYFRYRVAPDVAFADLKLHDLDGNPVSMNEYKGQAVFVNFWATWCGECRQEMPSVAEAQQKLSGKNISFVFISDDPADKVKAFAAEKKYPFRFLISDAPLEELGFHAIPATILLDKNGKKALSKVGGENWSAPDMMQQLESLTK